MRAQKKKNAGIEVSACVERGGRGALYVQLKVWGHPGDYGVSLGAAEHELHLLLLQSTNKYKRVRVSALYEMEK